MPGPGNQGNQPPMQTNMKAPALNIQNHDYDPGEPYL